MLTNTKIALAAAFLLSAASGAFANENVLAFNTCPALEGYPDCHPDGGATAGESHGAKEEPHQRHAR